MGSAERLALALSVGMKLATEMPGRGRFVEEQSTGYPSGLESVLVGRTGPEGLTLVWRDLAVERHNFPAAACSGPR